MAMAGTWGGEKPAAGGGPFRATDGIRIPFGRLDGPGEWLIGSRDPARAEASAGRDCLKMLVRETVPVTAELTGKSALADMFALGNGSLVDQARVTQECLALAGAWTRVWGGGRIAIALWLHGLLPGGAVSGGARLSERLHDRWVLTGQHGRCAVGCQARLCSAVRYMCR